MNLIIHFLKKSLVAFYFVSFFVVIGYTETIIDYKGDNLTPIKFFKVKKLKNEEYQVSYKMNGKFYIFELGGEQNAFRGCDVFLKEPFRDDTRLVDFNILNDYENKSKYIIDNLNNKEEIVFSFSCKWQDIKKENKETIIDKLGEYCYTEIINPRRIDFIYNKQTNTFVTREVRWCINDDGQLTEKCVETKKDYTKIYFKKERIETKYYKNKLLEDRKQKVLPIIKEIEKGKNVVTLYPYEDILSALKFLPKDFYVREATLIQKLSRNEFIIMLKSYYYGNVYYYFKLTENFKFGYRSEYEIDGKKYTEDYFQTGERYKFVYKTTKGVFTYTSITGDRKSIPKLDGYGVYPSNNFFPQEIY